MGSGRSFTLSDLARRLEVPQHLLIHLCEKGVVVPEVREAQGRGSSRVFSSRNFLQLAIALQLRAAMLPVAAVAAVLRLVGAFEAHMARRVSDFALPESLRDEGAPDVRVIVSDGSTIYFSLGSETGASKIFGGIPLSQVEGDRPAKIGPGDIKALSPNAEGVDVDGFGGPEQSQFVRLELSLTEVARALPLG